MAKNRKLADKNGLRNIRRKMRQTNLELKEQELKKENRKKMEKDRVKKILEKENAISSKDLLKPKIK